MDKDVRDELELAEQKKKEIFDAEILTLINELKETGKEQIIANGMCIKREENKTYSVLFLGTNINLATIDSKDNIEYNPNGIEQFKKLAEEARKQGVVDMKMPEGLPEAEYLKKLQKEKEIKEEEKEPEANETIKEEPEPEEAKEENKEDTKKENEQENKPKEKIVKEKGKDWIPLKGNRQADKTETVNTELQKATNESSPQFYIAPNENDVTEYKLMMEVDGGYKEIPLKNDKGTNPTYTITRINNDGVEQDVSVKMLQLNDDRLIAIYHNGSTDIDVDLVNRTTNGEYVGTNIANNQKPNEIENASPEIREMVGDTRESRINLNKVQTVYAEIKELDERAVPNEMNPEKDGDGIQVNELDARGFIEKMIEGITKDLEDEMPGKKPEELKEMAKEVARDVIVNDKQYEVAKQEMKNKENDNQKNDREEEDDFGPWSGTRERPRG